METSRCIVKSWNPGPFSPGLFPIGGDLLILKEEGSDACTLVWADNRAELWWIDSLPMGQSVSVPVHFGPLTATCQVTLTVMLDGKTVTGILKPGNDGTAGTFAAEGNGPPWSPPGEP